MSELNTATTAATTKKTIWGGATDGWLSPSEVRWYSLTKQFVGLHEALKEASDLSWSLADSSAFDFLVEETKGLPNVPDIRDVKELSEALLGLLESEGEDNAFLTPWWGVEEKEGASWRFDFATASGINGVRIAPLILGGVLAEYTVRSKKVSPGESSAVTSFLAGGWKLSRQEEDFEEVLRRAEEDDLPPFAEELDSFPKWGRIGR